jgi:phosphatidylserine decarboxylase
MNYSLGQLLSGVKEYRIYAEILDSMKKSVNKEKSKIYSMIFYLCPGDYHR